MKPCAQQDYEYIHIQVWKMYLDGCLDMRGQLIWLFWCQEVLKEEVVLWPDDCLEPFFNAVNTLLGLFFISIVCLHVLLYHTLWIFKHLALAQRLRVQICKKTFNLRFQYLISIKCCPWLFDLFYRCIRRIRESLWIFMLLMKLLIFYFPECRCVTECCQDLLLLRCRNVSKCW